jgi:hypothetical protein
MVQVAQIHRRIFFERVARAEWAKIKCQIVSQRVRDALPFLRLTTHRAMNPVRKS